MAQGWGIGGGGKEVKQKVLIPPEQADRLLGEDIHAIRERYVQPQTFDPQLITGLAAGTTVRIDRLSTMINALVVTVTVGTFNVWFGDYSGGQLPAAPHLQVGAGQSNQYMLPIGPYVFTVQAVGVASTGSIIPMAI